MKRRITAIILLVTMLTLTAVPAMAGDQIETCRSPYGITYTVNYTKGSADIAGKHIYFGLTPESTYVKIGGWRWAVGTKADELAAMAVIDSAWFNMVTANCPTIEDHYRWKNGGK